MKPDQSRFVYRNVIHACCQIAKDLIQPTHMLVPVANNQTSYDVVTDITKRMNIYGPRSDKRELMAIKVRY